MRNSLAYALIELDERLPVSRYVDLTVDRMIEIRNAVAEEFKGKTTGLKWIRLEAFRRTLEAMGSDNHELASHLNAIYLEHRFQRYRTLS